MIGNLKENSDTDGMPVPFIGVSLNRSRRYRLSLRPITIKTDSHVFSTVDGRPASPEQVRFMLRNCSSQESYE